MKRNLIFLSVFFLIVCSCSSKKNIIYLQNSVKSYPVDSIFADYKIKVDDILKIDIYSDEVELSALFSPNMLNPNSSANKDAILLNGYQVKTNGTISLPTIGQINVQGLTIIQLRNQISEILVKDGLLINPSVDVKLLNANFTVLGEVNKPGKHDFLRNDMSVLEAIGIAGDLTIYGNRKDIRMIRKVNDSLYQKTIDLTDDDFIYKNFQVKSGDIIIVNPNKTRIKNAGIIGNSGTLLSLLSFILSSIIVISN